MRREGPAGVEQHCPEQLSALPGDWSSVPSLNSFPAEGLKGLALHAGQNCVKRLLCIRGCTRVGQMGPSRSLFPLSHFHSHCLLQICTFHVTRPTWHLQDTVIFPHSLLCLHFSPPSLCLGTAWLSCSTPSSVLKFAVGVGSLWLCVVACEPAPLRRPWEELRNDGSALRKKEGLKIHHL